MKNLGIAALVLGICIEALAIFGNRTPYPIVLNIVSPDYVPALEGYQKLLSEGLLEPGDTGFDLLRVSYMDLSLMAPEIPFPIDEIDGVTITRFRGGTREDSSGIGDNSVVIAEHNNGKVSESNYGSLLYLVNEYKSLNVLLINCGLLILGCALVYYGLRIVFLDSKPYGEALGPQEGAFPPSEAVSEDG